MAARSPRFRVIGRSVPRVDGPDKVTGRALYLSDIVLPEMAHARLLRSRVPHARIRRIETAAAERLPGVVCVVTAADLADLDPYYGHALRDRPVLAIDRVRFLGEPVAIAVAEDARTADEALERIRVELEELPAATGLDEAMAPDAPVLHAARYEMGALRGFAEHIEGTATGNRCHRAELAWGDVSAGFAAADRLFEDTFTFPMTFHYTMEPYGAVALFTADGLTVWTSAAHPYMVQQELAKLYHLPLARVRVSVPYVGGAYGGKSYTKLEPLAAAAARKARRPVRLVVGVNDAFLTSRSNSARITVKTGVKGDGTLTARQVTILMNTGAYAENSPLVLHKAVNRAAGPYRIPHVRVLGDLFYTNTAPASSFRGFGAPQVVWAGESQMDIIADALGIDPLDLRLRNLVHHGEELIPSLRRMDADLRSDLQLVAESLRWARKPPRGGGHGKGLACSASDAGAEPVSAALVRVRADGSATVHVGSTEVGQGSRTVLAQIAAELLGLALDRVSVVASDTALVPYERSTGASRTTTVVGLAIQEACEDICRQAMAMAAEAFEVPAEAVQRAGGGLTVEGAFRPWAEIIRAWWKLPAGELIGRGYVRRAGKLAQLPVFWEVGMGGVELAVDRETGVIHLDHVVTVGDVGKAVNPAACEGQDRGAAMMGLGHTLFEEMIYEGGQLMNGDLLGYRVPGFQDLPETFDAHLVENQDGVGPYGIKGAGEGAVNPMAPAVANAVARAVGARIRDLPLTPERVWRAIRDAGGGER